MNWQHLRAFIWLRSRLLVNQWRRAGTFNLVLMLLISIGALVLAIPLFIACFILGLYAIPKAQPAHLLYVWDGLVAAFLFFWCIGLVTELQRSEPLALSKFLHLPVSANGAFLINYVSSLLRLSLLVFGPVMLAFALALIFVKGLSMALVLPALVAFFLMITALSYQLQGWLAALMSNPRRRRTVIVTTTIVFVLIMQLPNLLNIFGPMAVQQREARAALRAQELAKLQSAFENRQMRAEEYIERQKQVLQRLEAAEQESNRALAAQWSQRARLANMVLPIGWLPLAAMSGAEGRLLPAILGVLGMASIGIASLWRAYMTTLGLYQGKATRRPPRLAPVKAQPASAATDGRSLLETRIPGLSEPATAIALGGFRALVRSPEAKMMLLTPIIMIPIFGSLLFRGGANIPETLRPLVALGGMAIVLFGIMQTMGNQFGFDRDGFRVFVLCSAPRRDILLGKNLTVAPVVIVMAAIVLVTTQWVCPMRIDHLLALVPQYVSMFLLFCICANFLSIFAPFHMNLGSLKPSNPKMTVVLLQMVMFLIVFPLTQAPAMLPLGIELGLRFLGWSTWIPICLILSLLECAIVIVAYYLALIWQGNLLQAGEQRILEVVTNRAT